MHWPACVASINFNCQLINYIFPVLIWCTLALLTINECLRLILMVDCTGLMKILTQNKGKFYSLYMRVYACMYIKQSTSIGPISSTSHTTSPAPICIVAIIIYNTTANEQYYNKGSNKQKLENSFTPDTSITNFTTLTSQYMFELKTEQWPDIWVFVSHVYLIL